MNHSVISCELCKTKSHKIYFGEMSEQDMEKTGTTYWKCYKCGHAPLIWSNAIGDSSCEGCGRWQNGKEK